MFFNLPSGLSVRPPTNPIPQNQNLAPNHGMHLMSMGLSPKFENFRTLSAEQRSLGGVWCIYSTLQILPRYKNSVSIYGEHCSLES